MGELEIRKNWSECYEAEIMLMTMTVVWVQRGKRQIQASQAGIAAGLGTAVMYAVGW